MINEHDGEPVRGLPALLPPGERVLWQGSPAFASLARRGFRVGWVVGWFALAALWQTADDLAAGSGLVAAVAARSPLLMPLLLALAVLLGLAWAYARTTVYTVTNRRVVIRTGLALTVTVTLPFRLIESAAMVRHRDGSGSLALVLDPSERVSKVLLWPSVRPLRLRHPEPLLRCVPDVEAVADVLAAALRGEAPETAAPRPQRQAEPEAGAYAAAVQAS